MSDNIHWLDPKDKAPLKSDGGGGTLDGMERIAKLEARADFAEQRLTRIEDKLDRVLEKMGALPTTNGLWGMVATVIGVGIAIAGLTFAIAAYVAH
ncbi:hypothetical protein ABE527_14595 [Brucella sp. TWI432]